MKELKFTCELCDETYGLEVKVDDLLFFGAGSVAERGRPRLGLAGSIMYNKLRKKKKGKKKT